MKGIEANKNSETREAEVEGRRWGCMVKMVGEDFLNWAG